MIDIKDTFPSVGMDEWMQRLKKDLKSDDLSALNFKDEVEGITFRAFEHQKSMNTPSMSPGDFPYTRGANPANDNWKNGKSIQVRDEKSANKQALNELMTGIDHLDFELSDTSTNWDLLFEGIEFNFITCSFSVANAAQVEYISSTLIPSYHLSIRMNLDRHDGELYAAVLENLSHQLKKKQAPVLLVDGYALQQTGANCTQELAFMASTAHAYLVDLLDLGLNVDEAAACIHFRTGIGSTYFLEIAKIRSLRHIWSSLIKEYEPVHACSYYCQLTAKTGLLNKSAKDPYTNLLRQTTEVMSAVIGGAQTIIVTPYDAQTEKGISELSDRMATNISLILKEESYFDAVIDPLGGSYAIEKLTEELTNKGWKLFQDIEGMGGMHNFEARELLKVLVQHTRTIRLSEYEEKKRTLIGVTKFPNIQTVENSYIPAWKYLGMDNLIIERDMNYGN